MIEVRSATDRFVTRAEGRTTWHSFSFGRHYDPHNVGFGALVALNDEHLPVGTGYPDHPHSDTEIVTMVLSGALHHLDSRGNEGGLLPGDVQVLSSGSGVVHAEAAAPGATEPTRFLQAWVRPDESGLAPSYAAGRVQLDSTLIALASGDGDVGLPVHTRGATLHAARLSAGEVVGLPDAARLHVFLAAGAADLTRADADATYSLAAADAAHLVDDAGTLTSTAPDTLVLVWSLPDR